MHIHITFDIDWAPDWVVEDLLKILDSKNVKATFFCTHESSINKEIESKGHNLGIHPNFLPGSSQGEKPADVVNYLINLIPKATCIRTHSLFQSSPLFEEIFSIKSSLLYDFSLFTPGIGLQKKILWQNDNVKFWRLNYQWEDDCCFHSPNYSWEKIGLEHSNNIINFHPIHVYLNSKNGLNYKLLKSRLNGKDLQNADKSHFEGIINDKQGVRNALFNVINSGKCINFEDLLCELE